VTELDDEAATRGVPYSPEEFAWARLRPPAFRLPPPHPRQRVLYRHSYWGPVIDAVVEAAPDLDQLPRVDELLALGDLDENVWSVLRHPMTGEVLYDGLGLPRIVQLPDPWPVVTLKVAGRWRRVDTREARLRGAPGWLPLDWRDRWRPGPHHGGPVTGRGQLLPQGLSEMPTVGVIR
jgi:hypothetical protein